MSAFRVILVDHGSATFPACPLSSSAIHTSLPFLFFIALPLLPVLLPFCCHSCTMFPFLPFLLFLPGLLFLSVLSVFYHSSKATFLLILLFWPLLPFLSLHLLLILAFPAGLAALAYPALTACPFYPSAFKHACLSCRSCCFASPFLSCPSCCPAVTKRLTHVIRDIIHIQYSSSSVSMSVSSDRKLREGKFRLGWDW